MTIPAVDVMAHPGLVFNVLVSRHGLAAVLRAISDEYANTFGDGSERSGYISEALGQAAEMAEGEKSDGE